MRLDLFCTVVDNFGDIGVTWRLARQLRLEHGAQVRVWVDDLATFARLEPSVDVVASVQTVQGVEIEHWRADSPIDAAILGEVVIELFACTLDDCLIAGMAALPKPPVWINLEYLSAEAWVHGAHGGLSIHPRTGLHKWFFFPGFTAQTGGLFRERDYAARHPIVTSMDARRAALDKLLGAAAQAHTWPTDALIVSLFCYPHALVEAVVATPAPRPIVWLIPQGALAERAAQAVTAGSQVLPFAFLDQAGYDTLLNACDVNFVRGEDSFVRAQFAGLPFVWQAYEQAKLAHAPKIAAFLAQLNPPPAIAELFMSWNQLPDAKLSVADAWKAALDGLLSDSVDAAHDWRAHAAVWRETRLAAPDCATQLLQFVEQKRQNRL